MKYEAPKYEIAAIETEDILNASSENKYEVEENDDGSGSVIMNAFDLFN